MSTKINASEKYIKDLFSDKYLFEIPSFQRPYSWNKENIEQLFEDLKEAIENNITNYDKEIDKYEPYFLGSIIICSNNIKEDGSGKYNVIDGQQRLTSLVILMAVMRDLTDNADAQDAISEKIYQKQDVFNGTDESIRLKVRDKELDFYRKYILENGGTKKIQSIKKSKLSEPKRNFVEAIEIFYKKFFIKDSSQVNKKLLLEFIKYMLQKLIIVVVQTDNIYSAFRLFNVINARGMPLTNSDLLKSENLRAIENENERDRYAELWENLEEEVGREELESLISFIRSIKLKEKARGTIYEEFDKKLFPKEPDFLGKKFINYLNNVKEIYQDHIIDGKLSASDERKNVYYYNLISLMRNFISFKDWMVGVIKFKEKFDDDDLLYQFLVKYEKRITVDWINGLSNTERLTQIYRIIKLIEDNNDVNPIFNADIFDTNNEVATFKNALNYRDFYKKGRWQIPKYVLLRLDMERKDNESVKLSYADNISIEHILPQKVKDNYWKIRFNEKERYEWTNRFGNLVPLNGRKNSKVSNKPFNKKIKDYFVKKSDFFLVDELDMFNEWNLDNLKKRHDMLINEATQLWIN
ncbi:MAG: DUF262 domain-containing protein [bacterium]